MTVEHLSEFISWHERNQLPNISCVYAFMSASKDLLYIGSSVRLRQRILTHHRQRMMSDQDFICWTCASRDKIRIIEKNLIYGLRPRWNLQRIPDEARMPAGKTKKLSISLTDEILEQLKETKPSHRPMSQHIADLLVEGMNAKQAHFLNLENLGINGKL